MLFDIGKLNVPRSEMPVVCMLIIRREYSSLTKEASPTITIHSANLRNNLAAPYWLMRFSMLGVSKWFQRQMMTSDALWKNRYKACLCS